MENITRAQAERAGGKYWERGEMKRVYFNSLYERVGLELSFYNTGNISGAKYQGEVISNSQARKMAMDLDFAKAFVDLADGMIHVTGAGRFTDAITESIEAGIATGQEA